MAYFIISIVPPRDRPRKSSCNISNVNSLQDYEDKQLGGSSWLVPRSKHIHFVQFTVQPVNSASTFPCALSNAPHARKVSAK